MCVCVAFGLIVSVLEIKEVIHAMEKNKIQFDMVTYILLFSAYNLFPNTFERMRLLFNKMIQSGTPHQINHSISVNQTNIQITKEIDCSFVVVVGLFGIL